MASGTITKVIPDGGTGYCKIPDGTLLQWGSGSVTTGSGTTEGTEWVAFPTPFYGNVNVQWSWIYSSYNRRMHVQAFSVNGFTMAAAALSGSGGVACSFSWFAVGRWK